MNWSIWAGQAEHQYLRPKKPEDTPSGNKSLHSQATTPSQFYTLLSLVE